MDTFIFEASGANVTTDIQHTGSTVSIIANTLSTIYFGSNTLSAGEGNDILYGNARDLSESLYNGTITHLHGASSSNPFTTQATVLNNMYFGSNILTASGGEDILYGNIQNLSLSTSSNTSGNFIFGNNQLFGGTGSTIMYASVASYTMTSPTVSVITQMSNNQQYISIRDTAGNIIKWGNNQLTGGDGTDTFVFSLATTATNKLVMQGHNVIANFNNSEGADALQFLQCNDPGTFANHIGIAHSGNNSILNFDGGGSITLLGVNINSLDDIHNLSVSG